MIPLRLELTNFLSYRETAVLDFTGIHLACIAGMNGAGKSSVLDSMTWALFGQSRSRSDDDVVNRAAARNGETAEVVFDFELEQVVYRILRRKKSGRAMVLELQVASDYDAETGAGDWKSLTMAKRKETEGVVIKLLRMNYDTFSNASFLLQGKADEFTTKTAGKRKEILADLLGLGIWEEYREGAAVRRKLAESELALLEGRMGEVLSELAEEPARLAAFETAAAEQNLLAQQLTAQETVLQQARRANEALQQQKKSVSQAKVNLAREQKRLQTWQAQYETKAAERVGHATLLGEADAIQAAFAAYEIAQTTLDGHQTQANEHNRIRELIRPRELTIAQEKSRLTQQEKTLTAQKERVAVLRMERETVTVETAAKRATLADLQGQINHFDALEARHLAAREDLQKVEAQIKLLEQEQSQLAARAKQIDGLVAEQAVVGNETAEAEMKVVELTAQLAELSLVQTQQAEATGEKLKLEASQSALKEGMDKLKDRLDRLDATTEGACPLCGQALTDQHRLAVIEELRGEGKEKGDTYRVQKARLPQVIAEIKQFDVRISTRPTLERSLQKSQNKQAQAQARMGEIGRAIGEWMQTGEKRLAELTGQIAKERELMWTRKAAVQEQESQLAGKAELEQQASALQKGVAQGEARLAEIERTETEWETGGVALLADVAHKLANNEILPEEQLALADLTESLAQVGYDSAAHEAATAARDQLAQAPKRYQAWERSVAAVALIDASQASLATQISEQEKIAQELDEQYQTATKVLASLTAEETDLLKIEREVHTLREGVVTANRKVGRAEQNLRVLDDRRIQQEELTNDRAEITHQIQRLKLLEKSCGKNGVQALLIEQALPEIEEAANQLLSRLTEGQMQVTFDTQKQLKSRDATAETLDIRLSDNAGVRPYENFSGGEQFRVNFAIRIALSQVLAKRAGARLQTLVIDEGFGSQDPNGRARLVEAITAIQDDFKRILVITHIAELREAFPTQIFVEKTGRGSQIRVV